jgi:Tfp pilus assembly ATPase PilU
MNLVYLIQAGDNGPILIGTTTDKSIRQRTNTIQHGNHEPLHVLAAYDGDQHLERQLHVRFADHRIRGDWYSPDIMLNLPENIVQVIEHDPDEEARQNAIANLIAMARP